jgi:hypothetical protein
LKNASPANIVTGGLFERVHPRGAKGRYRRFRQLRNFRDQVAFAAL